MSEHKDVIEDPYLIIVPSPCYQSGDDKRYVDPLWAKDLREHFPYIKDLRLAAPLERVSETTGLQDIEGLRDGNSRLQYVELPPNPNHLGALIGLPCTAYRLWKAIKEASIVHTDILHGWPYSYGWLAVPMALLQKKPLVTFVESTSIQMVPKKDRYTAGQRLRRFITDKLARFCAKRSNVAFVGYDAVKEKFFPERPERCHVSPFIWLLPEELCTEEEGQAIWKAKASADEELRLLIVVRLVASKGTSVLLKAMEELEKRKVKVRLDIFGMGPEESLCRAAADKENEYAKVHFHGALQYGAPLFEEIKKAHVMVQPLLSMEQPRIIFDAFSQALPVLASNTEGLSLHVKDGQNGWLVEPGNVQTLADKIQELSENTACLEQMGMAGLEYSQGLTLPATHRRRAEILVEAFAGLRRKHDV